MHTTTILYNATYYTLLTTIDMNNAKDPLKLAMRYNETFQQTL